MNQRGRGRLQSDFAHLSQELTPSEAYLRLLTLFHAFQVLIKMADSHGNCQHQ